MSKIEKLQIRGIRSFGPDPQNIEFFTPLTLIVGHNGAGKTTIIECLKYATTGNMPPGSSGGAFIFDPKVAHETETKAQIKLRFTNASGLNVVVARSLVLSQKSGGKSTQKTLEGMLTTTNPHTGEQVSVSAKCATLDTEIPNHLGVSKAVLENVIFCHQEESYWPLAEPAVLKKKFDELFDATRYTKALDQLKSIKKDQVADIKLAKQQVEFLQSDRERAKKINSKLSQVVQQIADGEARVAELDVEIRELYDQVQNVMQEQQKAMSLANQIENMKHELSLLVSQEDDLRGNIHLMTEEDDEMETLLEQQTAVINSADSAYKEREQTKTQLESKLNLTQRKLNDLAATRGKYLADRESHERKVATRDSLLKQLCNSYQVSLDSITESQSSQKSLSGDDAHVALMALRKKMSEFQNACTAVRVKYEKLEQDAAEKVHAILAEKKTMDDQKTLKRKLKQDNIKRLSEIASELSVISNSGETLQTLKADFEQKEKEVEHARNSLRQLDFESKIKKLESDRSKIESQLNESKEELTNLSRYAETSAKLSIKKEDKQRKEENYDRIMSTCTNDMKRVFGADTNSTSFQANLEEFKSSREQRKQKIQYAVDKAMGHAKTLEAKLNLIQTEIKEKQARFSEISTELESRWSNESLEILLPQIDQQLSEAKEKFNFLQSTSTAYKDFAVAAKRNKNCPLCERGFEARDELETLISKLHKHVADSPRQISELQQKIASLEAKKKQCTADMPLWNNMQSLNSSISELQKMEESLQTEVNEAMETSEDSQGEMAILKMELVELQSLSNRQTELQRLKREIDFVDGEISQISTELAFSGTDKTIEEVQSDIESLENKDKQMRKQYDRLNNEWKMRQNDLLNKEKKLGDNKVELMTLEHKMSGSARLQEQRQQLIDENQNIDNFLKDHDSKLSELDAKIKALESERNRIKESKTSEESMHNANLSKIQQEVMQVESVNKEIEHFHTQGVDSKLEEVSRSNLKLQRLCEQLQQEIADIAKQLSDAGKKKSEIEILERNIRDNIRLRKLGRDKLAKEKSLDSLLKQQLSMNIDEANNQLDRLNKQLSVLNGERSGTEGSVQQLKSQRKQLKSDLRDDYDGIEDKYRGAMVDCATLELANTDLEKYAKAVDAAIMKFHSIKMDEINRSIRELWMSTYKGHDIDTIEIRSDAETARGNRSYNYRVVMVKGDAVLDMRGRCSAGQKVLASLIIRLALAESFCHHCGILTLDEPTTNLDEENIESLAKALHALVEHRQAQSNFQLVVITHDEKFVHNLGGFSDYYYRIYKNPDGMSCIERNEMD